MKKVLLFVGLIGACFYTNISLAGLLYENTHWRTLKTRHFLVHHPQNREALARKCAAIAEKVYKEITVKMGTRPRGITHFVLIDQYDQPNGFAGFLPHRQMTIFATPPYTTNSLEDYDDWLDLVIRHEFVHIVHLDYSTGIPGNLRSLLGNIVLFYPHALQPSFLLEGLATHHETDVARGIGRGQSAYYQSLMRMEVLQGIKPFSQVSIDRVNWPAGTIAYLYGVYFYQFLNERYGATSITAYLRSYSDNVIPFALNSTAKKIYKKNYNSLWQEFRAFVKEKFQKQIDEITSAGLTPSQQLTHSGETNNQPYILSDNSIVYFKSDGFHHPAIHRLSQGKSKKLRHVNPSSRFDVHEKSGIVLVQPDVIKNNKVFYDIYKMKLNGRSLKRLTKGKRYTFAIWNAAGDKIIAIHNQGGKQSLHQLNTKGQFLSELWPGETGVQISYPNLSPDGTTLLLSVFRPTTGWGLETFSLESQSWLRLELEPGINIQGRYTPDGDILYVSDSSGVFNIKKFRVAENKVITLSNLLGGAYQPVQTANDNIVYSGLGQKGFDLYQLSNSSAVTAANLQQNSRFTAAEKLTAHKGKIVDYRSTDYFRPTSWFPYYINDGIEASIGLQTAIADPLQRHFLSLFASYDLTNQEPAISLYHVYDRWYPLFVTAYSRIPTYTKSNTSLLRIDQEETAQFNIIIPKFGFNRDYSLHLGIIKYRDFTPINNIGPIPLETHQNIGGAALTHDSAKGFKYSMHPMQGRRVRLIYETDTLLKNSFYSGEFFKLDWREYKRLSARHSINLRVMAAKATHTTRPIRLGGLNIGIPSVLGGQDAELVFNKRDIALRGYPLGQAELIGRNALLTSIEWRWPITRIEKSLSVPPIGIHSISGSVFFDAGDAWNQGNKPETWYRSYGMELKTQLSLGYIARIPVSIGYAQPMDLNLDYKAYIKIGTSF